MSLIAKIKERAEDAETTDERCETSEKDDVCSMAYYGKKIETVEQLLEDAKVDLSIWEVKESSINNWEVAGKHRRGDGLWKTGLRQIKVRLQRRAPKIIQDGIKLILAGWKPNKKQLKPPISKSQKNLVAFHLNDAHFGKRCWAPETSNNYDLDLADTTYRTGFASLLEKTMRYSQEVDRFRLRVGDDFFHVNDSKSRTGNETRVESTDDRFSKVFSVGCQFWLDVINRLLEIAPVDVDWIPGNHDPETSWYLATLIHHVFSGNKYVKVDLSPRPRKYYRYGITVIGMCHGEKVADNKLPSLMISEARHLIDAKVQFREWHLAHLHIARQKEFLTEDSLPNTTIRRFPSMCGTDGWHTQNGFADTYKMAESSVYSFERGPDARFTTHA